MEINPQTAVTSAISQPLTESIVNSSLPLSENRESNENRQRLTDEIRVFSEKQQLPSSKITEQQYLKSIRQLESEAGAYAPRLWEKMQGLALTYYNQGMHEEAVSVFKRALHVYRINNGLYHIEQIPILQQMIDNHIVLENFSLVDDHHYYLYRTRLRNFGPDNPKLLETLREYANWQREAYLLEVGENIYQRLIIMHDAQTKALELVERTYGFNDSKALLYLEDLLDTQYLIASYTNEPDGDSAKLVSDKSKFNFLRLTSYTKGLDILARRIAIYDANPQLSVYAKAEAFVALGDWYQWNKRRTHALKTYAKAYNLLAECEDDEDRLKAVFGKPIALPAPSIFDSELLVNKGKKKGYVVAEFAVTDYGAAEKISFLSEEPKDHTRSRWRLKKTIKETLFRPRFENAMPVSTERVIHRYEFYY